MDANPDFILTEAAAANGYTERGAARILRDARPEAWKKRRRVPELEDYKSAGEPPHVAAVAAKLCPDRHGIKILYAECREDPYFSTEDAAFLSFYVNRQKLRRNWDPSRAHESCKRALAIRDALVGAGLFKVGTSLAAERAGIPFEEAEVVALCLGEDYDAELEKMCADPPQEYLDEVNARDFPGVRLPKDAWDRYYSIYRRNVAGKFSNRARHGAVTDASALLNLFKQS